MANGYGGARKGAGRPKGSVRVLTEQAEGRAVANVQQLAQAYLETRLLKNLNNLGNLADGIQVKEGDTPVYSVPPDRQSNIYLLDRYLGKPTERVEDNRPPATNNTLVLQGFSIEQLRELLRGMPANNARVVDGKVHEEGT